MESAVTALVAATRRLMPSREYKRLVGGISEMTRWRHERAGIGPQPVRQNGRLFYFEHEVLHYLEELAASRDGLRRDEDARS